MNNVQSTLPNTFSTDDLIIDDEGYVVFKEKAYPLAEWDCAVNSVLVEMEDDKPRLSGQCLDRHLSHVRFTKLVANQKDGWYHWDQIEELSITTRNDDPAFRVIVKSGAKPYERPIGLVNYFLEVLKGYAYLHPDAVKHEYCEAKAEFEEFKAAIANITSR